MDVDNDHKEMIEKKRSDHTRLLLADNSPDQSSHIPSTITEQEGKTCPPSLVYENERRDQQASKDVAEHGKSRLSPRIAGLFPYLSWRQALSIRGLRMVARCSSPLPGKKPIRLEPISEETT